MPMTETQEQEMQGYMYSRIIQRLDRAYVEFPFPSNPLYSGKPESAKVICMLNWFAMYLAGEKEPIAVALELPQKNHQAITLHAACNGGAPSVGLAARAENNYVS